MKRIIILACLFPLYISFNGKGINPVINPPDMSYEKLVSAIIHIESKGNHMAVGRDMDYGLFQITPIRIKDYNQKTGKNYRHEDAFNPVISREIFDHYAREIGMDKHEEIARNWNGGPRGMQKEGTKEYWNKVSKHLNKNL